MLSENRTIHISMMKNWVSHILFLRKWGLSYTLMPAKTHTLLSQFEENDPINVWSTILNLFTVKRFYQSAKQKLSFSPTPKKSILVQE